MNKFLDLQHPFFAPLGIRIATTAAILGWAVFEWFMDNPMWATGFGTLGVYCFWVFFFGYQPRAREEKKPEE